MAGRARTVHDSRVTTSSIISRASAILLALGGLALLFAPDVILPALVPDFPAAGAWIGQLLAAAWLGVAVLDWLDQSPLLGGIYGRPIVMMNAILYFISTMTLLRSATRHGAPVTLWLATVPMALFAGIYWWLLLRGPLERDLNRRPS